MVWSDHLQFVISFVVRNWPPPGLGCASANQNSRRTTGHTCRGFDVSKAAYMHRIYCCVLAATLGACLAILNAPNKVAAHSGGTDSYGCHNETAIGTYHCHSGAPVACQNRTFANQAAMLASGCRTATTTTYSLIVLQSGSGKGTVTSSPTGISCGNTCTESFDSRTSVTLTPTASTGSTFAGWSGDCTGTGTCSLTMSTRSSMGGFW